MDILDSERKKGNLDWVEHMQQQLTNEGGDESTEVVSTSLPGDTIANGSNFSYCDRSYVRQPCHQSELGIKPLHHKTSMARFGYLLVSTYDMEDEFSPFLFSVEKMVGVLDEYARIDMSLCSQYWEKNEECHLFISTTSVLYGGNELRVAGKEPVHQIGHADVSIEGIKATEKLQNKIPPCSFLIPLQEKRTIFKGRPNCSITTFSGTSTVFRGDMTHGGRTTRKLGKNWNVAVHGHLQSKHFKDKEVSIAYDYSEHSYVAPQHLMNMSSSQRRTVVANRLAVGTQFEEVMSLFPPQK